MLFLDFCIEGSVGVLKGMGRTLGNIRTHLRLGLFLGLGPISIALVTSSHDVVRLLDEINAELMRDVGIRQEKLREKRKEEKSRGGRGTSPAFSRDRAANHRGRKP